MRILLPAMLCLLGLAVAQPAPARDAVDLPGLRAGALAAVNRDRVRHRLPPLRLHDALNAAAQAHANDMLRRNYFDHASPEGHMVSERFQEQGGSRWLLVEENISVCTRCPEAPDVWRLEQDWMDSPSHRENILRHGLTDFGFGIANVQGTVLYAVQTFAGPGTPRGTETAESSEALTPPAQVDLALRQFNTARRAAGLPPLQASGGLTELARRMVSNHPEHIIDRRMMTQFNALSNEASAWQEVRLEALRCGGCGVRPTAADVVHFAGEFLHEGAADANPLSREADVAGFAMLVDGKGMKSAVLLVARRR